MRRALLLLLLLLPSVAAQNGSINATVDDEPILHRWENPLPPPLDGAWGAFALNISIWAAISLIAVFAVGPLLTAIARRLPGKLDDHVVAIVRVPGFLILFVFGVVDSVRGLPLPSQIDAGFETGWKILLIIAVTLMVYRLFREVLLGLGKRAASHTHTKLDDRLYPFFAKVGGVLIWIAALFFLVGSLGVDLTVFAAGGAFLSLVIAFAAQDTLGNFFAGIFILLDQPFREGDRIEIQEIDTWGDVVEIGLRSTRIRTRDNRMVIVPNSVIGSNPVVNHSFPTAEYRIGVDVGVAYGSDIARVTEVLLAAARSVEGVNPDKRIEALFREFGDSALKFHVRAWFPHYVDARRYEDKLNRAIDHHLAEAGIEIPFPQRVVHLRDKS